MSFYQSLTEVKWRMSNFGTSIRIVYERDKSARAFMAAALRSATPSQRDTSAKWAGAPTQNEDLKHAAK